MDGKQSAETALSQEQSTSPLSRVELSETPIPEKQKGDEPECSIEKESIEKIIDAVSDSCKKQVSLKLNHLDLGGQTTVTLTPDLLKELTETSKGTLDYMSDETVNYWPLEDAIRIVFQETLLSKPEEEKQVIKSHP